MHLDFVPAIHFARVLHAAGMQIAAHTIRLRQQPRRDRNSLIAKQISTLPNIDVLFDDEKDKQETSMIANDQKPIYLFTNRHHSVQDKYSVSTTYKHGILQCYCDCNREFGHQV